MGAVGVARKTAAKDDAVAEHHGINPIEQKWLRPIGYGSVCFWSLAYLANSILLDQRLQESCAVGITTFEPVVLGFCWASVWGHHHVCHTL
jgi:hypothetical protein